MRKLRIPPPRGISKASRVIFSVLTLLFLSIGQVWGKTTVTNQVNTFSSSSTPTGWTVSSSNTHASGYLKISSGDYLEMTTATVFTSGEVLSSDNISVAVSCGTFGTWSGAKSVKVTVEFRKSDGTVLTTANSTFSSLTSSESAYKDAITVAKPTNPSQIAYLRIIFSNLTTPGNGAYLRVKNVKLSYETDEAPSSGCEKKVTISKGTPTNGDFLLDKTGAQETCDAAVSVVVTPNPAEHYKVTGVTAPNSSSISEPDEDGKYTVTYAQNTNAASEINVTFTEKTKYTVTWNNNGSTSSSQVYDGEKPVFPSPNPTSCDATSTTFIGWATEPWEGKEANLSGKTVYTKAADMPEVTANGTIYYAVFAKVSGASGWNLTNIADLTSSDVFVLADASGYALNNDGETSNAPTANAITVSDGKITSAVADNLKWNISGNATDGYTFYPNGSTTTWLYCNTTAASSSNNNMRVGTGDRKVFVFDNAGVLVTDDSNVDRYLCRYMTQDFRGYINKTTANTTPVVPKFYKYSAGSASDYMTTCCTKYNITIADGIEHGSIAADLAKACEGTTVTITFSPDGGYHLYSWSVNGDDQDVNDNTFAMPAEDVEVSAVFEHDPCSNLLAPTLNGTVAVTYNSATINWNAPANASSYDVAVVRHSDSKSIFSGNLNALTKALTDLDPETQYDYSIMGVGDGGTYCTSGNAVLAGNFTTDALPTAHLTLKDPSGTHASSGDYTILTPFNLPSTAAACAKTFMGWDSDEECATAPTYAKGAEFTFANTTGVTLYAVYADVTGGSSSTTNIAYSGSTTNMTGNNDAATFGLNASDWSVVGIQGGSNQNVGLNKDGSFRLYYNENGNSAIQIEAPQTVTSVALTFTADDYNNAYVKVGENLVDLENGVYPINATSFEIGNANTSSVQVRISNIAVNFTTPGTPSNYSTTCAAAPEVIIDPEQVNVTAAAVAAGVIEAAYDNVDEENLSVLMFNDQACTEAFDGGWLTASINGDKNIAYTIAEYTSYASNRTAYIQLTAPASSTGVAAAKVVIPVTQAKKDAVFASLEALAASDVPANSNVTVSFSNVPIKEIYIYNSNRRGLTFNIQKAGQDIKIYYNADVPAEWVAGGKVSGTLTNCLWKIYSEAWQLAPSSWAWENLTYTAPPAIESIEIRGNATAKTYIDGQAFNPAGLSVIAIYNNSAEEDVTAYATWTYDPATLSEDDTEVEVTAEYNGKEDSETITGLTVNPIPNKTIAQFIAADGTRCYLEGTVSNYTNTTKGYFDLTDNSGTIHIYGCTSPSSFAAGDKIKVIAETYEYYQSTTHQAKNVEYVSKISPVEITIANKNLYVNDTWTIEATTDPAGAVANISYSLKDGSEPCIDEAELANGVVKAIAEGDATIIATIPDGEGYLTNSIEFNVHVNPAIVRTGIYAKVTSNEELTDGEYLIVYETDNLAFDGSLETLNVSGNSFEVTIDNGKIIATAEIDAKSFTITNGTIKSASGKFIGKEADSNGMDEGTTAYTNTLSIVSNNFEVVGSGGAHLRYNSSSDLFRYYKSSTYTDQKAIQLYKKMDYTRTVSGNYGTICLPKAGVLTNGVLYEISYYDADQKKIFFDEVEGGVMVAGAPYIFKPNENVTELKVAYTDVAVVNNAGHKNGLYGHYDLNNPTEGAEAARLFLAIDDYFLLNNEYWKVDQENRVYVDNYRAYIKLDKIGNDVPPQAYGRRRVAMNVNGEQVATGMDELNASEAPVKMMINGQLFILRGEKLYDTTGRLVK